MAKITVKQLLEAGAHFGHNTRYWNPKMAPYIFGARNKIHIIDLRKTEEMMNDAMNFMGKIASRRGKVMFVGTKRAASKAVKEEAVRCGMPFVSHRWLGGMLTNFKTVRASINRLKDIEAMQQDGRIERFVKKEQLEMERERTKLEKTLGGIKDMKGLPDALFILDTRYEAIAINEAKKLGIPVVAVVDTNNNFNHVDYVIPANDDAMKAIRLYAGAAADSILEGKAAMQINVKEEKPAEAKPAKTEKVAEEKVVKKEVAAAPVADKVEKTAEAIKEEVVAEVKETKAAPKKAKAETKEVKAEAKTTKKVTKKKTTKKKTTKKKVVKKAEE
ncbi:SSU ribosomal protein S2P [Marinicella litoralis]|uniref:Small ribosomal subunit protein uS2 n=1 Tax=Marinicella litoralis TaxID=644220 RepID=A0A4R6XJ22_9GAMM|nr:SSU ribosomal protein S2P [Marinicella litoralis]